MSWRKVLYPISPLAILAIEVYVGHRASRVTIERPRQRLVYANRSLTAVTLGTPARSRTVPPDNSVACSPMMLRQG